MKLYVIPVEKDCNGSCKFCITKFRDLKKGFLKLDDLKVLDGLDVDKIEITGGGEPFLHSEIGEIIERCCNKSKTQVYTNGLLVPKLDSLQMLEYLCVSRAHYLDKENKKIMGVDYNFVKFRKLNVPIKLSLLVHKSGIYTVEEVKKYLDWAIVNNVRKVVIRQLFEEFMREEHVSSEKMFKEMKVLDFKLVNGNPVIDYNGMEVEFEIRCSCEAREPVLHADGNIVEGWEDQEGWEGKGYDFDRRGN